MVFWGGMAGGPKATDPKGSEQMFLEGLTKLLSECKAVQRRETDHRHRQPCVMKVGLRCQGKHASPKKIS